MKFTKKINEFLKGSSLEEIKIGCSDSNVYKITSDDIYYLKVAKKGLIKKEYDALTWLNDKLSVPEVILFQEENGYEYLITRGLKGDMVFNYNVDVAIKILKTAFDSLYSVDISSCPFNVSLSYRLETATKNVLDGLIKDKDLKKETLDRFGSVENLLKYLKENKIKEELCFTHGDPSLPNIFAYDSKFSGFIDMGECGIGDKWFDLAICEKSIIRNFGSEYARLLYDNLNIVRDKEKVDYYLLLLELFL